MQAFTAIVLGALFASQNVSAFAPNAPIHTSTISQSSTLLNACELVPEPEGGGELTRISSSMEGSRMKNLGAEDEEGVFKFWLSAKADGALIKKLRLTTEKEASRKANFPGFRKGQIPPYAQPQMTGFAVQEGLIKTCEQSLEAFGLESLPGSKGEVTVNEDIKALCKGYKIGTDVAFTATYKGKFDSAVQAALTAAKASAEESSDDGVIDVEVVGATEAQIDFFGLSDDGAEVEAVGATQAQIDFFGL